MGLTGPNVSTKMPLKTTIGWIRITISVFRMNQANCMAIGRESKEQIEISRDIETLRERNLSAGLIP